MVCLSDTANDMENPEVLNNRDRVSIIAVVGFVAGGSTTDSEAQAKSERGIGC